MIKVTKEIYEYISKQWKEMDESFQTPKSRSRISKGNPNEEILEMKNVGNQTGTSNSCQQWKRKDGRENVMHWRQDRKNVHLSHWKCYNKNLLLENIQDIW